MLEGLGPTISLGEILPTDVIALGSYLSIRGYASELGQGGNFDLFQCLDEACSETVAVRPTSSGPTSTRSADLIYNPATGEVWLKSGKPLRSSDPPVAIDGFLLSTDRDDFQTDNLTLPFEDDGANTDVHPKQIGQVDVTGDAFRGFHALGAILPTSMSESQFRGYFTAAEYSGVGSSREQFDLAICQLEDCSDLLPNPDVDADGDVDTVDAALVSSFFRASSNFLPGTDVDRTGRVDEGDTAVIRQTFTGVVNAPTTAGTVDANVGDVQLIYNRFSGEVLLRDPSYRSGEGVNGFVLGNADGSFRTDNLQLPALSEQGLQDVDVRQIGVSDTEQILGPVFKSLGRILPADLATQEDLASYFTHAFYSAESRSAGIGPRQFELALCETESCVELLDPSVLNWVDTPAADLIYNPFTGDVRIDPSDIVGPITGFNLTNDSERFLPDQTAFPFTDNGDNTTNTTATILQSGSEAEGVEEAHDLGNILPPGMISPRDVAAELRIRAYTGVNQVPHRFDVFTCTDAACEDVVGGVAFFDDSFDDSIRDGRHADLIYNPFTGNVRLDASDTASEEIISYVLGTDQDSFLPDNWIRQFDMGNHDATVFQIGENHSLNEGVGPVVDLGNIFPTGLETRAALADHLTLAQYASELGMGGDLDLLVCGDADCTFFLRDPNGGDGPGLGNARLIYDPITGRVTIDVSQTDSGRLISFVLATDDNSLRPENLIASGDGSSGPFFDVGTNTDSTAFQIGQTDPLNQGVGPIIELGSIFPAGMTQEEFNDYLSLADYASELGVGGEFDLIYGFIPEPSGFALITMGMLMLVRRRKIMLRQREP